MSNIPRIFVVLLVCGIANTVWGSATGVCTCTCSSAITQNGCTTLLADCNSGSTCTAGQKTAICSITNGDVCPSASDVNSICASSCNVVLPGCTGTGTCSTSSSSCFPANATVELEGDVVKRMDKLEIGDKVLVSRQNNVTVYSDVYMFSHRMTAAEVKAEFVHITTAGGMQLMLTSNHYLFVNGTLAVASVVRVGDTLTTRNGESAAVLSVARVWGEGLYNPQTLDGNIIVNGILTSTYTSDVAPSLAHAALWPVRMLYSTGLARDIIGNTFAGGSDLLAALMPDGKPRY